MKMPAMAVDVFSTLVVDYAFVVVTVAVVF